jgi:uncharacterized protein with GYD domain
LTPRAARAQTFRPAAQRRAASFQEDSMATYIILSSFTDQGIRGVRDTAARADAVKDLAKKLGIEMREIYWTLGPYDVVALFDSPDDAAITALALAIGSQGNVRTQVLRAFDRQEMKGVLGRLAGGKSAGKKAAVPA